MSQTKSINDNELIEQIISGRKELFSLLIDKYSSYAFTIANRILKNRELAEEVCQDAFLTVYQSLYLFKQTSTFSTWLYRIVFNKSISETRKKGYKIEITSLDNDNYSEENDANENLLSNGLEELIQSQEIGNLVQYAINTLDEISASVITMYYLNECTIEEILTITGLTKSNIKILLFRARKKMFLEIKKHLGAEYEYWK